LLGRPMGPSLSLNGPPINPVRFTLERLQSVAGLPAQLAVDRSRRVALYVEALAAPGSCYVGVPVRPGSPATPQNGRLGGGSLDNYTPNRV
jgi:hypothetical protein